MALNVSVQVLTQPGATGNQTISLAANFDPKAVIVWATPQSANGGVAHYSFGKGFGTYRGSVVQQRYVCIRGLDAAALADTAVGSNSDALLCLLTSSAGSAARDLEIDLVSMQGGATSQVVINWVNLHTTASIRIFMLVLGGSEITDALVDDFTTVALESETSETVVSGFGKPDLLFMLSRIGPFSEQALSPNFAFGFAKQGEAGRGFGFTQTDGNTASITAMRQRSDIILNALTFPTADAFLGQLDTVVSNWPTDGFLIKNQGAVTYPSSTHKICYLAIRTTAQIATGANTAPSTAIDQDNACGFVPKLGFLFGWNTAPSTTRLETNGSQCGFGVGAYDGATEAWAGFTEDDAATTMDSNSQQSIAKVHEIRSSAGAALNDADGVFSGNNFRLSWTTIFSGGQEYQWLAMGDAPIVPAAGGLKRRDRQMGALLQL